MKRPGGMGTRGLRNSGDAVVTNGATNAHQSTLTIATDDPAETRVQR